MTHFAERTIGIKAKLRDEEADRVLHFAERTIGIKAKLTLCAPVFDEYFAERTIGIKAKPLRSEHAEYRILPKEQLESRQSEDSVVLP